MGVILRTTRKIKWGKMAEYRALHDKLDARWRALGQAPLKAHYQIMGANTVVADREWESLAAFEASGPTLNTDPELVALRPALYELIEDQEWQFLISM